ITMNAQLTMEAIGELHGHLTPTSAGMVPINGLPPHHPHAHLNAQGHGQLLGTAREPNPSVTGAQVSNGSNSGQMEEINTKEVAQRITTELKRYSIPQAIFAQRVLCRSQGTLSDLLRNPKPWSKLKSGRETFRRMWKWLQEPEFQRMSALRLAGERAKELGARGDKADGVPPICNAGKELRGGKGQVIVSLLVNVDLAYLQYWLVSLQSHYLLFLRSHKDGE
ncbi:hypothetical protein E2I00_013117, partial [Balaenoptera physalus]